MQKRNHAARCRRPGARALRTVKRATVNDWGAICRAEGEIYKSEDYKGLEMMDRAGGTGAGVQR